MDNTLTYNSTPSYIRVCICILALYAMMPVAAFYVPSVLRVMLMVIVLLYITSHKVKNRSSQYSNLLGVFLICILYLLDALFNNTSAFSPQLYFYLNLYTLGLVFIHEYSKNNITFIKQLAYLIIAVFTINALTTIWGNQIYPGASRALASSKYSQDMYEVYLRMNIGGFEVIYTMVLMLPLLIFWFKQTNKMFTKIACGITMSLFAYTILVSEYTTALLATVGVTSFILMPSKFSTAKSVLVSVFVIALILISGNVLGIFSYISDISGSEAVNQRMNDLTTIFQGQHTDANSDVEGRSDLYMQSISSFISHPIFGYWIVGGVKGGGHSFILDTLSQYGIFSILVIWIMLKRIYRTYVEPFKASLSQKYIVLVLFLYIIFLIINPQPYFMFIVFVMPILNTWLNAEKNK